MRLAGLVVELMTTCRMRTVQVAAAAVLSLLLLACDSVEVIGPAWVHNGQIVTYILDMEPYYNHVDATVYVVVEIPEEWTPVGWSFSGMVAGVPVQGTGSWILGDPGNCPKSPSPTGYKRVYAVYGVFADLQTGRDQVDAALDFNTEDAPGVHHLTFWVEAVDNSGVTCNAPTPLGLVVHQWERLEWEQLIGTSSPTSPGLGGVPGRFYGLAEFQGQLYAAVLLDVNGYPSEVWRTADGVNWELVRPARDGEFYRGLVELNGRLVMFVYHDLQGNPDDQWELWATDDGVDWELLTVWLDWPRMGIGSPGLLAVILRSGDNFTHDWSLVTSADGESWMVVGGGPFADQSSYVGCGTFLGEKLYLGGSYYEEPTGAVGPRLWSFDGASIEIVDTTTLEPENESLRSLAVHGDRLFVGTSAETGGEVWSFDGVSQWQRVGDNGLGLPGDSYIRDLAGHLDSIFAIVRRDDESQIWVADRNFIWSKSDLDWETSGSGLWWISVVGGELFAVSEFELWRRVLLFEGGFETGSPSRWSNSTPVD
jgi:hypothetical protein